MPECYAAACGPVKRARLLAPVTHLLLFALGVFFGPAVGLLNWSDAAAATPVIALCCGIAGAGMAARLDARSLGAPALITGAIAAGIAGAALGLLLRLLPAAGILGGTVSVSLVFAGLAVAPRSLLAPVLLAAGIALNAARRLAGTGLAMWVLLLLLATAVTAMAFRTLSSRPTAALPPAAGFTTLLVGAGIGTATGTSPLLVCWGAALALGAASPGRSALRALMLDAEGWAVGILWFAAGIIAAVPAWPLLAVALTLALVLLALAGGGKFVRVGSMRAPEPVALALVWAVALVSGRGLGTAAPLVTTAALALLGVQFGPVLPTFVRRLTRKPRSVEVSA